ncbi:hypothetical protein HHI36_022157 [Cryptolaemus montrouzieri]|uniref:TRAFD1/XAF1 zinc finger domain-containing protein n=1 Tax=Cryptolaemus montrouzieri TaxID=559131 RepID=A0ABD2N0A2_9CUCU
MADEVEHEICGNCKKEIPHYNYVMHTAHCARNITLCKVCKEPVPKLQFEEHAKACVQKPKPQPKQKTPEPPKTNIEKSPYFQARKEIADKKQADKRERFLERHEKFLDTGYSLNNNVAKSASSTVTNKKTMLNGENYTSKSTSKQNSYSSVSNSVSKSVSPASNGTGAIRKNDSSRGNTESSPKPPSSGLLACRYCELELPKMDLEAHENYCGARTDKCLDCGEFVMYKYRQMHLDTNHGFLKLNDGCSGLSVHP